VNRPPALETERLVLVAAGPEHAISFRDYVARNREHFAPFMPPQPADYYTLEFWHARLSAERREMEEGQALRFVFFERDRIGSPVVGDCSFTEIVRGPFQACYLGYRLDRQVVGRGFMDEALRAAIRYAFTEMKLHRIMANYQPTNERSGRLLRRLGFTVEGYARDYLFVAGAWRDHILTSLTNPHREEP
jgi:ribosomal-protein-alanine N-acetyltransferase